MDSEKTTPVASFTVLEDELAYIDDPTMPSNDGKPFGSETFDEDAYDVPDDDFDDVFDDTLYPEENPKPPKDRRAVLLTVIRLIMTVLAFVIALALYFWLDRLIGY